MKLNELVEKGYGDCEVKDGITDFIVVPRKGKVYSTDEPEIGQTLYKIFGTGGIHEFPYDIIFKKGINQGSVFYDMESAKEEVKRREVYHKVEKYSYEFSKKEWEDNFLEKWYVEYRYLSESVHFDCDYCIKRRALYFKSKKDIQTAIEEVGKEDFIKYFLGVE